MNTKKGGSRDADILASKTALRRAAKRALQIGLETGTPVWVIEDGRIVDLTKGYRGHRPKKQRST